MTDPADLVRALLEAVDLQVPEERLLALLSAYEAAREQARITRGDTECAPQAASFDVSWSTRS